MKQVSKTMTVSTTALFAIVLFAMAASNANATDYCRTDVTAGMRGCGYTSYEQCLAMSSGRGGTCDVNPFAAPSPRNAFAKMGPSKSASQKVK